MKIGVMMAHDLVRDAIRWWHIRRAKNRTPGILGYNETSFA